MAAVADLMMMMIFNLEILPQIITDFFHRFKMIFSFCGLCAFVGIKFTFALLAYFVAWRENILNT
jgi:hypothetical protein